jgi:hypothetical protein
MKKILHLILTYRIYPRMEMNLCPHCHGWLTVRKKQCRSCGLMLETEFEESPLTLLAREEQDFLLDFILAGGSFKALSERLGLTYPTTRTYYDRIVEKLRAIAHAETADGILAAIDRGEIRPEEGIEKLKKIRRGEPPNELAG